MLSRMGVGRGVVLCTVGEFGRMEGDATARLLVAGGWRLDRIPALRLAELAHAKRVKLCVQECVGVRQNVGMFGR